MLRLQVWHTKLVSTPVRAHRGRLRLVCCSLARIMPSLGQAITLALLSALPWPFSYDSAPAAVQQECTCRCECGPCSASGAAPRGWAAEAVLAACLACSLLAGLAGFGLAWAAAPVEWSWGARRTAALEQGRGPQRRVGPRGAIPLEQW